MAEISIADVNAAIVALIASPEVDYTIGDKSFKSSQKLNGLLAIRKALMENPEADIKLIAFDIDDIDELGIDDSQEVL
jgi:hypothetical protein